jgi:hypothetical protein
MRKLVALVALAVLVGCGGGPDTKDAAPSRPRATPSPTTPSPTKPSPTTPTSPVTSTPTVSTSPPTGPYALKGRLHLGDQVVPGRFGVVTTRGRTWVAYSMDETMVWGMGADVHRLPNGGRGWLSPSGRYLLTASRWEDCGDDDGKQICVIRLLDTTGAEPTRRLVLRRPIEVVGVSNQGVVVLTESAALRWDELVWDAAGGASAEQTLTDSPPMTEWAMKGWEPIGFGHAGFEFTNSLGHWLGKIVDGELRPLHRLPATETEPGPGGKWAVDTAWPPTHSHPATKQVLRAWRLQGHAKPARLRAPRGWSFAQTPTPVVWESADTFLAVVVDSRKGGDRLARCDIPLATCVTVAD